MAIMLMIILMVVVVIVALAVVVSGMAANEMDASIHDYYVDKTIILVSVAPIQILF